MKPSLNISNKPIPVVHAIFPVIALLTALVVFLTETNLLAFQMIQESLSPLGEPFWTGLTLLGDALVGPLFLIPFLKDRPRLIWEGVLTATLATIFTHVIKPLAQVARPPVTLDIAVMGPRLMAGAFPSGHTTTAFAVLGLLVMVGALRGMGPIGLGFILAALIGLSRIVAGVHWPLDVLVGAAGGWVSAVLAIYLADRWEFGARTWSIRIQILLLMFIALYDLFLHDTGYPSGLVLQRLVALIGLLWLAWDAIERYYLTDKSA